MAKGDIFVRIGVDVSQLEKGILKAGKSIEKFGKDMKMIGRDLTQAITVPITGLAYAAMRSSREATFEFDRFTERTKRTMGTLGTDIAKAIDLHGVLNTVSKQFEKLVNWFSALDKETKKQIVGWAAFAAALGPVLMIGGRLIEAFGIIFTKVAMLSVLLYKVVASIAVLAAGVIGWPALIIAAAAALVGFVVGWENVANAAKGAAGWIAKASGLTLNPGGGGLGGSDAGGKYAEDARERGGPMGAWRRKIPLVTIPGAAPSGLSNAERNEIEDGPRIVSGADKESIQSTQAMVDAQRKLGFELELSGNKAQYYQGMIAALKQEYIALREGGLAQTAPEVQNNVASMATTKALDATQAMLDAQKKLGLELETTGNKAQYHQGMIAALKQEYIALREGGLEPAAPAVEEVTNKIAAQNEMLLNSQTVIGTLASKIAEIPPLAVQFGDALFGMFQQLAQGIGNTLAQVIVYGGSMAQAMKAMLKQILASIISTLIQMGIQWVITSVLKKLTQGTEAAATLAAQASIVYAQVFASYAGIPFVGPALGAAAGAAASASMLAGAAAAGAVGLGVGAATAAGAATGGLFTTPGLTAIAERGKPEIVLNQDNVRKFMGGALGGGNQTIIVNLDSEPIISTVVRGMPAYLRLQGAI